MEATLSTVFGIAPLGDCVRQSSTYTAEDFDIEILHSSVDYNENGVDDYTLPVHNWKLWGTIDGMLQK